MISIPPGPFPKGAHWNDGKVEEVFPVFWAISRRLNPLESRSAGKIARPTDLPPSEAYNQD